jgi:hypothetical protein
MEACECKLGLGLDADGRQGLGPYGGGLPTSALQQSRLADAWLARIRSDPPPSAM